MATYVFSDVHGHAATLNRVLDTISPAQDDVFYCLGDMIDRGPDPIEVLRIVRGLPNAHVLMGNHEDLMMACLRDTQSEIDAFNWGMNGGQTTSDGLAAAGDEADELVEWVSGLSRAAWAQVGEKAFFFAHAGIDPANAFMTDIWNDASFQALIDAQDPEDLLWIREDFWGAEKSGLVDTAGKGPIVIAGHTPTPYLERMTALLDRPVRNDEGLAQMVCVGASDATGGVADRIDIDCGAAGGFGFGQVMILRLDDMTEFYEPVREGE